MKKITAIIFTALFFAAGGAHAWEYNEAFIRNPQDFVITQLTEPGGSYLRVCVHVAEDKNKPIGGEPLLLSYFVDKLNTAYMEWVYAMKTRVDSHQIKVMRAAEDIILPFLRFERNCPGLLQEKRADTYTMVIDPSLESTDAYFSHTTNVFYLPHPYTVGEKEFNNAVMRVAGNSLGLNNSLGGNDPDKKSYIAGTPFTLNDTFNYGDSHPVMFSTERRITHCDDEEGFLNALSIVDPARYGQRQQWRSTCSVYGGDIIYLDGTPHKKKVR